MNFPKNASKQHKVLVYQYVAHFVEKKVFVLIFIPFHWFDQKHLFKQIQIFLRIYPFSHMVRKTNFLSFSLRFLREPLFWLKREVLYEFHKKCFKTTERHTLAVCGSLCGDKQFMLIFIPFNWFDQKSCLNKSKFSSGLTPFQTW